MAKKKGPGGKLSRSEILQTRLSPKLRFAAEIMAREQRRTLSSLFEYLTEEAAKKTEIGIAPKRAGYDKLLPALDRTDITVAEAVEMIWHPNEAIRFVALAERLPYLLDMQESMRWYHIVHTPYLWTHYPISLVDEKGKIVDEDWLVYELIPEHLNEYWPLFANDDPAFAEKIPDAMGKKVERPAHMPATKPQYIEGFASYENLHDMPSMDETPDLEEEDLKKWLDAVYKHTVQVTDIKKGRKDIRTYRLPSREKQLELLQEILKKKEKKDGN